MLQTKCFKLTITHCKSYISVQKLNSLYCKTFIADFKVASNSLQKTTVSKLQIILCKCCISAAKLILRNYKSGNVSTKKYLQICKSVQNLIYWNQNCKSLITKILFVLHMFIKTANTSFKNYFFTNLQMSSNKNYLQNCKSFITKTCSVLQNLQNANLCTCFWITWRLQ